MSIIKKRLEILKEMYYNELEQKEKINTRITIPIAVITTLIALAVFYFKGLDNIENSIWGYVFYVIYSIYLLSIFAAIIFVFRAYYNYKYSYLPKPDQIEEDISKIYEYYEEYYEMHFHDKGLKPDLIEQDIDDLFYAYYKNATIKNIPNNEKKLKLLRRTGNTMIYALIFAALSIIPYQLAYHETKEVIVELPQLVEFLNTFYEGEIE